MARCSRHAPLAVPLMFVWAGPALWGAVNSFPPSATSVPLSFQTRNRWLLPLMSTVARATTDLPEPSLSPPDSQVFTAPCVQEENLQGKFGFFDITVLSPVCSPFISSTQLASLCPSLSPSILHREGSVRKWEESEKTTDVSVPRPALPCPATSP